MTKRNYVLHLLVYEVNISIGRKLLVQAHVISRFGTYLIRPPPPPPPPHGTAPKMWSSPR